MQLGFRCLINFRDGIEIRKSPNFEFLKHKIFELKNETIVNMRKNALKVIKENFDYNFVIDEYIKMYKSLIK